MEPLHSHPDTALSEYHGGFTLVELLVVLSIIVVITGIVITSQSSFNKTLILANTAYDVALSIRSAETYGVGSRAVGGMANVGHGVHFVIGNTFTLFADTYPAPNDQNCHGLPNDDPSRPDAQPGDCVYEAAQGERVMDYTIGNGITITDICVLNSVSNSWTCTYAHPGASAGLSSADIVFSRPNSDVFISRGMGGSPTQYSSSLVAVCISLSSPQGGSPRFVTVASSGNIAPNALSCP